MRLILAAAMTAGYLAFSQGWAQIPALAAGSEHVALDQLLVEIDKPPIRYRALRWLEAESRSLNERGWLEARTELDPADGFRYQIVASGGSARIQHKVLRAVLEAERKAAGKERRRGAFSTENYAFEVEGRTPEGWLRVSLTPKRKDARLVLGSLLLSESSGNLRRVQGRLSKSPSFWVRWVDVTRLYSPVAGVMMPVEVTSVADVRFAGRSTFVMTYQYEMVNGTNLAAFARISDGRSH